MRETELAKPVADWMRSQGYTVYAEVPLFGRCLDFVGIKERNIICVELKISLTKYLIRQAYTNQLITTEVYVGVGTKPRKTSIDLCRKYGLGVLSVKNNTVTIMLKPTQRYEPMSGQRKQLVGLCKLLKPSDDAGKPQQAGEGPAQDCQKRIDEYRKIHLNATWKEIYRNVPNHYSNVSSLYGAMRMARERKWRANQRVKEQNKGQQPLFPVDKCPK